MRNFKRLITILLALVVLTGSVSTVSHATTVGDVLDEITDGISSVKDIAGDLLSDLKEAVSEKFSDYDTDSWYASYVAKLVGLKGINGYPDGTFKPNGEITRAEFTKILIASIYGEQEADCPTHWACPYVKKAIEVGLLEEDEFTLDILDLSITRQEMAKLIVLASEKTLNEESVENLDDYKGSIKDYFTIDSDYREYILSAYAKGIITGYTDNTFRATNSATRAEASTMLVRLLDESERAEPEIIELEEAHAEIETFDDPDKVDFRIYINTLKPLENQFLEAEEFLNATIGEELTKEVLAYAMQKVNWYDVLPRKEFAWGDKVVVVSSRYGEPIGISAY